MESSGAGAHVALATPTPVPQSLNDLGSKMDFDSLAWMGLDDAGTTQESSLLQSPFDDTFVTNPFQASNVRQSIDDSVTAGAQAPDQTITAPANFSLDDAVMADGAPPLPFDASIDTNNLDNVPVSQDVEPFNFDDAWDQPPPTVPETSLAPSEPEQPDIAEMNGFAQLSFQDGEFLVTSTQVILGRDDKFAKKYQQEQKLAKKRLREGSRQAKEVEAQEALHEYQQEPSHPSAHGEEPSPEANLMEGRPARGLASAYSEQGGIVGLPEDEKRRRKNKKRRRNLLLSGQSSSTTSVAPANLHTFKYDVSDGPDDDTEDAQKPVFLPVHPNNPADIKLISREHLQIEYSGQNSRWELKILGRSAYVKNEHYHVEVEGAEKWEDCEPKLLERDEVAVLTHLTEIIVASLRVQFRLPVRNKVVSTFDSDDSELSDALSDPVRPTSDNSGGERSDSDLSDEDDAPLSSVKQKKLKKQKEDEKAKAGKKPVMLNLKKRKNSEPSPMKPPPVTPKSAEKGKRPKKSVVAGSEPEPVPQPLPVVEEKKEAPKQPIQLHLPPPPTEAQLQEQAADQATILALTQADYAPAYESAPPQTPASGASAGMVYAPQQPAEPVAFEPGSMLSEVPMDQLPEKRKGPGRPPKNGLISKRDMGIIRRKQKEFEKQGIPVPPLDELVRIVRSENKAKEAAAKAAARGEAPPPMAQSFPIMQSIEMLQEPSNTPTYVPAVPQPMQQTMREGDYTSVDPELKGSPKRQRTYRSPSPMKSKEECTEEELKKPNHTYYTTLDEILSEGPPEGLELQQIYDKICKKYPYYKYGVDGHGWQSSVRHNLKQHDRFQQVTKQGKGWLWAINQEIPFDKEKKRKPTPPPVQRPPMPYPMANGMPHQPGMQQYGNPYAYGQPQYQQQAAQPGQQYGSPYNQTGQQPYAQPGAPQQYVQAGSQPPANQQYPYAPQHPQPQQPPYQPNGVPPAPVPARTTPTAARQGSGTPHPQPGFNNLVDEIMAYRSDYLRPYAHLQSTPLYKEQEDVFKKCVEWISELQCNGTPQLNFANEQERRVFADLERIMRKYQNPAPTSAPATSTQPPNGNAAASAPANAQAPSTTVNGDVTTATAAVDANTAGTKRSAPEDISGDGSDAKRMKVEGDGGQPAVSVADTQTFTTTADQTASVQQTAPMSSSAPVMDIATTQAGVQSEPVFDFSNPSGAHEHEPVFDFSTPDQPGDQGPQFVFDFSEPTPEVAADQPQHVPSAPTSQPSDQQSSQPQSSVPTPHPPQQYSQPPTQSPVVSSPHPPPQQFSQPQSNVPSQEPGHISQPQSNVPSPLSGHPSQIQSLAPTQQPGQPSQPNAEALSRPSSTGPAHLSQPHSQPARNPQNFGVPPQQPVQPSQSAQQNHAPPQVQAPSVVPSPQDTRNAPSYIQSPTQPQHGIIQPQPGYSQPHPNPPSTSAVSEPTHTYSQSSPNQGPDIIQATQSVQHHPQASRPASATVTPQPPQVYQPPPQTPGHVQPMQQPSSQHHTPMPSPVPRPSTVPVSSQPTMEPAKSTDASGHQTPTAAGTGTPTTPATQT